ncbi:FIST sensor-containing signal transduction protein [Malaciobacter mytili LMG 24559]|nr:FIST C-terminal domain-containing protein [Malaciobacter mytili]AXH14767.1 FIST sensor-containing signal transduction protein [Malaciobacter mytili LMG 24559]
MSIDIKYYKTLDTFVRDCKGDNNRYLLFIAQECKFYISLLKNSKIEAYGAIFPEIILDTISYKEGLIAYKLNKNEKVFLQQDINNLTLKEDDFENINSVITFVDGLSLNINSYLDSLYELLAPETQVIGGGAGKIPFEQKENIFSNEGIYKEAALIICLENKIKVGFEHGWSLMQEQAIATLSKENTLFQIDYINAYEFYKSMIEKDLNKTILDEELETYLKTYPLGLVKFDNEILVKEIIKINKDKSLVLGSSIPQNSIINFLKGEKDVVIEASKKAALKAVENCNNKQKAVFLFECVSRRLFLDENHKNEIEIIKENINEKLLIGLLTLGEIVNNNDMNINFYNKTCIVGALC